MQKKLGKQEKTNYILLCYNSYKKVTYTHPSGGFFVFMRLTYTDIKSAHFRNIGSPGVFTDTTLLSDFQYNLGQRYQLIFGSLSSYINQDELTSSTVASQQYYYYPPGTVSVDSATITIGSVKYTLNPIYDQGMWNYWNALQIQPTAIPQFIYPRKNDFGIWPIPTAAYTITFQRFYRDRNLLVDDYTTGTIALTNSSTTVVGSGTTFTPAMVGRWLVVTDTSVPGQGYWYRIGGYTNATHITLETYWAADTTASVAYRIGETPEIPEEAHIVLPNGTAADYYSGLRSDSAKATLFNNAFWTGDMNNSARDFTSKNVAGGLIGLIRKYKDRERDNIIIRQPQQLSPSYKIFAESIS